MQRLTDGLWYERTSASVSQVGVRRRSSGDAEPVLRLRRGVMNGRRVHVDLVLLGGDRAVEVSFHPAATVDLVRGHARRRGHDANGWLGALLPAVVADAARWGSWTPPAPGDALAVLGGVTHPLLGAAYDAGVEPAGEIPRWASPALAESSAAACGVRLFGAPAATRATARALGGLLLRPRVAWWQLAAGAALTSVGGADDLAAVLGASGPDGATPRLPTAEDVAVLRAGISLLEPARAKRLVLDAVTAGGEGGVLRLAAVLRALLDVKDDVRWPPPVRLADLEAVCLRATAVDPAPAPPRPTPRLEPRPPARSQAAAWTTPRRAPATARPAPAGGHAFEHPPAARALDRRVAGDVELVLPRTPDELRAWGRMLGNCLGDFAAAVAEHRSVVLGVRERGALVAAAELTPDLRDVRQLLGPGNRVPPRALVEAVVGRLDRR